MKFAIFNGVLGIALSLYLGLSFFGMDMWEVLHCVVAANIAGFCSVFITLEAERINRERHYWKSRIYKSWIILVTSYTSILYLAAPPVRPLAILGTLYLPLILSTGFAIIAFGPVQDRLVRQRQKKSKSRRAS